MPLYESLYFTSPHLSFLLPPINLVPVFFMPIYYDFLYFYAHLIMSPFIFHAPLSSVLVFYKPLF